MSNISSTILRKVIVISCIFATWEMVAILMNSPLILPRFSETAVAFFNSIATKDGRLIGYVVETSKSLFAGYLIGALVGSFLTIIAISNKLGGEFLTTITGAFAPLPAVAIFPLALMWFGISYASVIFIAAFATVFPLAVSMTQGFRSVSETFKNVGRNVGMSRLGLTFWILIPASLPAILSGLRNGFSNSFRALVAVEMVIGAATGSGGLGWFVMTSKMNLDIPLVYAGILSIMAVGLIFEGFFTFVEGKTVKKWGMLSH